MGVVKQTRRELAAAFRWAARFGYHEAVANHFSAAVSDDGQRFLVNPVGSHFSRIRASDLVDVDTSRTGDSLSFGVDPTAWVLHSHIHRHVPRAKCILHTHMKYATTLACLEGYEFQMTDQNACRFHDTIAYDRNYSGLALDPEEGERVAGLFGADKEVLFLGNHGVMVIGPSVAEAFDLLYYLEKASEVQVLALSTGRPLSIIPDEVAAHAARQWREYPDAARLHMDALMAILDEESPDYAK